MPGGLGLDARLRVPRPCHRSALNLDRLLTRRTGKHFSFGHEVRVKRAWRLLLTASIDYDNRTRSSRMSGSGSSSPGQGPRGPCLAHRALVRPSGNVEFGSVVRLLRVKHRTGDHTIPAFLEPKFEARVMPQKSACEAKCLREQAAIPASNTPRKPRQWATNGRREPNESF